MNELTDSQKVDYLNFLAKLREICKVAKFKIKVAKLQPCYFEPSGNIIPSPNDLLTLIWDDD